ncbi:hypothetical protein OWC43_24230, partial [Methylorubrum sp. POS3]
SSVHIPGGIAWPGSRETNFWWEHGASYLSWTLGGIENAIGPNKVPIAQYWGGNQLRVQRGAGIVMDGGRLTALSIDADRIQANAIQARHIAANQITGDKIVGGSIVAGHIAAGQITGTHVAANTLSADHLTAGSITAKHIRVSDPSNMVFNGDFGGSAAVGNTDGWSWVEAGYISTWDDSDPGGKHRWVSQARHQAWSNFIDGTPGDVIYVSAMNFNSANYYAHLMIVTQDAGEGNYTWNSAASRPGNQHWWARMEGRVTLPASARRFRVVLLSDRPGGGGDGSYCYWGKVQARRAAGASLIVDGAITAEKLSVGSLSAVSANMGTVTAGRAQSADGKFVIDFTDKYFAIFE